MGNFSKQDLRTLFYNSQIPNSANFALGKVMEDQDLRHENAIRFITPVEQKNPIQIIKMSLKL